MAGMISTRVVRGRNTFAAVAALALAISAACGSGDDSSSFGEIDPGPHVIRTDETFTKESFISAGWKESEAWSWGP